LHLDVARHAPSGLGEDRTIFGHRVDAEEPPIASTPWLDVQEPNRICDSSADVDVQTGPSGGSEPTTMNIPRSFSDEGEVNTWVNADMKSNDVDVIDTSSATEMVETNTDDSSVHTLSTMSHIQYYPRPKTRTSTASPSADSASSNLPASSEGAPATPTDVRPPPLTNINDLPTLPIEAQLKELFSLPLVSHRRTSLFTRAPAPVPPTTTWKNMPISHNTPPVRRRVERVHAAPGSAHMPRPARPLLCPVRPVCRRTRLKADWKFSLDGVGGGCGQTKLSARSRGWSSHLRMLPMTLRDRPRWDWSCRSASCFLHNLRGVPIILRMRLS